MNKKKLPKAIVWTASDMQAKADNDQRRAPPTPAVMNEPPARDASVPHNVIEMVPKSDTASATAPTPDYPSLAQRRLRARASSNATRTFPQSAASSRSRLPTLPASPPLSFTW